MDWASLLSLFGGASNGLGGISASPNMGMGQLGTSLAGMNVSSDFPISHGPDYMKMLGMAGGLLGGQEQQQPQQQAMPMQAAQLQAGGGLFTSPYQQQQQHQFRPTSQALSGIWG